MHELILFSICLFPLRKLLKLQLLDKYQIQCENTMIDQQNEDSRYKILKSNLEFE